MLQILENYIGMSYSDNELVFSVCAICFTIITIVFLDIFAKIVFNKRG